MKDEHDSPDKSHESEPTFTTDGGTSVRDLETTVQDAQDTIESLEDDVPAGAFTHFETVEQAVKNLEDSLEKADSAVPDSLNSEVQIAQEELTEFRKNLAGADADLRRRVNELEDGLKSLEDATAAQKDGYGVKVGEHNVVFFDESTPKAEEVLARVNEDTDDVLVASGDSETTYSGDDRLDLSEHGIERFTAEPTTPGNS